MCSYCDRDDGHTIDECPDRLEDKFGTGPVELRESETRDDDHGHADATAQTLAMADDADLERAGIDPDDADDDLVTDGGETIPDECQLCRLLEYRGDEINEPEGSVSMPNADDGTKFVYCCKRCADEMFEHHDFTRLGDRAEQIRTDGGNDSSDTVQRSSFISIRDSLPHRQPFTFDLRFISPVGRRKAGYKAPQSGQMAVTSSAIAHSISSEIYMSTVDYSFLSRTFQPATDRSEGTQ